MFRALLEPVQREKMEVELKESTRRGRRLHIELGPNSAKHDCDSNSVTVRHSSRAAGGSFRPAHYMETEETDRAPVS